MKPWIKRLIDSLPPEALKTPSKRAMSVLRLCDAPDPQLTSHIESEAKFLARAQAKGAAVFRAGWPDFFFESKGKSFCVEVKKGADMVRPAQARMFAALERAGLKVFIWNPRSPHRLTPWRKYVRRRQERSSASVPPATQPGSAVSQKS